MANGENLLGVLTKPCVHSSCTANNKNTLSLVFILLLYNVSDCSFSSLHSSQFSSTSPFPQNHSAHHLPTEKQQASQALQPNTKQDTRLGTNPHSRWERQPSRKKGVPGAGKRHTHSHCQESYKNPKPTAITQEEDWAQTPCRLRDCRLCLCESPWTLLSWFRELCSLPVSSISLAPSIPPSSVEFSPQRNPMETSNLGSPPNTWLWVSAFIPNSCQRKPLCWLWG